MTNRFMISVAAAAFIAGTGFANAQGTGMSREGTSGGSTVQQSAPSTSEKGNSAAPTNRDATESTKPSSGMKATQSDEKAAPGGAKNQRAQDDMKAGAKEKSAQDSNTKGDMKSEKSAQDSNMKGEKSKSMSSETNDKGGAAKDMKAEGRDSKSGNMNADSKNGNMNAQTKSSTDSRSQTTTGNAATSATAAPPPEKQTQIASAIRSEKIEEVNNVNFELNVGARVPTSVRFYPLPPRIVEIYPEWRGYEVIRVHGRYVIVRPQTHEIVYIIEG